MNLPYQIISPAVAANVWQFATEEQILSLPQDQLHLHISYTDGINWYKVVILNNVKTLQKIEGDKTYVHNQSFPASTWIIQHNLGKRPAVTIEDTSHREVIGGIESVDNNTIVIYFSAPFSGFAYCN